MPAPNICANLIISKLQPNPIVDDSIESKPIRGSKYAEPIIISKYGSVKNFLAEEGSYIIGTNPTISTGLTWVAARTTFLSTAPNFYIENQEQPSNTSAKNIFLDTLKLIATAVAATSTAFHYAILIDNIKTVTTDNTLTINPVKPNGMFSDVRNPLIKVQNSAATSVFQAPSTSSRIVARGTLGGLNIIGDEFLIVFGNTNSGSHPPSAEAAGQPGRRVSSAPPILIAPQKSASIYIWMPGSTTSINPEFELGLWAV